MSNTAFVTGASGFLGSHIARELLQQGWDVHVLARDPASVADNDHPQLTCHAGDLTDAASIRQAMPDSVDGVFHVAASTNIWSRNNEFQTRVNVDGTQNVIDASIEAGAGRFIHTSSFTTWGFQDQVVDETSPRNDATDWINYVRTKHLAEQRVLEATESDQIDSVILNPGHILGPGDRNNWSRMVALIDADALPGVPPGSGPFADVQEVALAHIKAFHQGRTAQKYLLGGPHETFVKIAGITGELLNRKVPQQPTPAWLLKTAARVYGFGAAITGKAPDLTPESAEMITRHLSCDSSLAQRELDYRFSDVRSLLQQTIGWMREEGMLQSTKT